MSDRTFVRGPITVFETYGRQLDSILRTLELEFAQLDFIVQVAIATLAVLAIAFLAIRGLRWVCRILRKPFMRHQIQSPVATVLADDSDLDTLSIVAIPGPAHRDAVYGVMRRNIGGSKELKMVELPAGYDQIEQGWFWEKTELDYATAVRLMGEYEAYSDVCPPPALVNVNDAEGPDLVYLVRRSKQFMTCPANADIDAGEKKANVVIIGGKMLPSLATAIMSRSSPASSGLPSDGR